MNPKKVKNEIILFSIKIKIPKLLIPLSKYIEDIGFFNIIFLFIIALSIFLRFYNFPFRWGLGNDDARDALIALEALKRHELPLMGPFSSAGPFVTGGIYYWFIMLSYFLLPSFISSPWIFSALFGVLTVFVLIKIGQILGGGKFAIILGLLAATSPQLVVRSLALSNPSYVLISSVLLIYFFLMLWKTKKIVYGFFAGFFLGLSLSFHYQAINLLIFLPAVFFISFLKIKQKIISFFLMLAGFILPLLPLLYWDWQQHFANLNNILDYFLIVQNRIYIPNSWKLFLFDYLPSYWSYVEGHSTSLSISLFFITVLFFLVQMIRKKLSSSLIMLGFIFLILIVVNRFYKGERSEGYLLYLAPFILIMSSLFFSWLISHRNKYVKITGLIFILIVVFTNLKGLLPTYSYKSQVGELKIISQNLSEKFPNTKFALYNDNLKGMDIALGMSLIMDFDKKLDINGQPLGISCRGCHGKYPKLINSDIAIYDLRKQKKEVLNKKSTWLNVNKQTVYESQIGWLNKQGLTSTFSLKNYIINIVGL